MVIRLSHYDSGSVLILLDGKRQLASICYTQPSHRYRSESDYATLVTEHRTYGDQALSDTFAHLVTTRARRHPLTA
jgi:hypothetical protein